jgi:hypothetical protein
MLAASSPDWNVFKQIYAEHWDGFKRLYPRCERRYYDGLVHQMLACGNSEQMGYIEYRCLCQAQRKATSFNVRDAHAAFPRDR